MAKPRRILLVVSDPSTTSELARLLDVPRIGVPIIPSDRSVDLPPVDVPRLELPGGPVKRRRMPKEKRTYFLIGRANLDRCPTANVLDMLRHDAALVECNPPRGYYMLSIHGAKRPTVERWRSFVIEVLWTGSSGVAAHEWAARERDNLHGEASPSPKPRD